MKKEIIKKILLIILCVLFFFILLWYACSRYVGERQYIKDVTEIANQYQNPIFSVEKLQLYSNANAVNNSESKAMWNLNVSQYTDIAIFLKIHNINSELTQALENENTIENQSLQVAEKTAQNTVTRLWIDSISFSNTETGDLSLTYQNIQDFGKWNENPKEKLSIISYELEKVENIDNSENLSISSSPKIDEALTFPITLRYQNSNIKTNCLITNIKEPLVFDGSILKRCSIPLSSIKNTVSMKLHIVNSLGEEFVANLSIDIPLQNENSTKTIYDGSYSEKIENISLNFLKK